MDDLERLRKLSGIAEVGQPNTNPKHVANISHTGTEKARIQREKGIKPGTPEWFQLWFSLPKLTGEKPVNEQFTPMQIAIMEGGHSLNDDASK